MKNAPALVVTARVKTHGQTGVEMEALTAVSVACLTIYDMLKAADRAMIHRRRDAAGKAGWRVGFLVASRLATQMQTTSIKPSTPCWTGSNPWPAKT